LDNNTGLRIGYGQQKLAKEQAQKKYSLLKTAMKNEITVYRRLTNEYPNDERYKAKLDILVELYRKY
jgi:hypothetical protein